MPETSDYGVFGHKRDTPLSCSLPKSQGESRESGWKPEELEVGAPEVKSDSCAQELTAAVFAGPRPAHGQAGHRSGTE